MLSRGHADQTKILTTSDFTLVLLLLIHKKWVPLSKPGGVVTGIQRRKPHAFPMGLGYRHSLGISMLAAHILTAKYS